MTDQEKSVVSDHQKTVQIINLMPDWSIWGMGEDGDDIVLQIDGKETAVLRAPDYLFAKRWMFLAWRVLNWAMSNNSPVFFCMVDWFYAEAEDVPHGYKTSGSNWFRLFMYEPADAQRAWLDKILTLAIEAGMVTK